MKKNSGIIVVFNANDKSILNSYQGLFLKIVLETLFFVIFKKILKTTAHSSAARCVAFTKDDTCVVSAGDNGQIVIFNLKQVIFNTLSEKINFNLYF